MAIVSYDSKNDKTNYHYAYLGKRLTPLSYDYKLTVRVMEECKASDYTRRYPFIVGTYIYPENKNQQKFITLKTHKTPNCIPELRYEDKVYGIDESKKKHYNSMSDVEVCIMPVSLSDVSSSTDPIKINGVPLQFNMSAAYLQPLGLIKEC
jgi:hypothetical protein